MSTENNGNEFFSSKWGMILSVLGIAVGTGNIWRFPRIVALNGGAEGAGAFIFAWVCCLLLFSIPLIIAEYGIGRYTRKGTIGSFIDLLGKNKAWMGAFVGFVAVAIMFYYSVVTGWAFYYLIESITSALPDSLQQAQMVWQGFQGSIWPVVCHALMMFLGGVIIVKGVATIEKISMILLPSLVLVLVISLIRAVTLPGSMEGIIYFFTPQWSMLGDPEVWLAALTQNAWDTGAGWGLILTYAIYMRKKDDIKISAFQTGIANNCISLIAGITIFSAAFAILGSTMAQPEIIKIMRQSGPASSGLTFMWLPQLFNEMAGGRIYAILFFLGLTFAAFTSLVSMIELATRVFIDMGYDRKKVTIYICITGFLVGLPSAISIDFLANQDFVWAVGLMLSGAFISYAIIKFGAAKFRNEVINNKWHTHTLGKWWEIAIKYVVPFEVIALLVWWFYKAISAEGWYNPFSKYTLATIIVQWGIALGVLYFMNDKLAEKTVDAETGKN